MKKIKVLSEVGGFVPLIDQLVKKYGLTTAAVFGRMWGYCQMSDRACRASQTHIANDLCLCVRSVQYSIIELIEGGYLEDTTPELKNCPHTYRDTGKIKIRSRITAEEE